jgi:hypothetical protein
MKKIIMSLLVLSTGGSLQGFDEVCESSETTDFNYTPQRATCFPGRVYALRRFDSEGEINYTDTSWPSKLEDSFYDNLTH